MFNRVLGFLAACILILAVAALIPAEEVWAAGSDCTSCPSGKRCPSGSDCGGWSCSCVANPINETGCHCNN